MNIPRYYVDTSVIGGCLDPEFAQDSRALLQMVHRREITLVVSDLLVTELDRAPAEVQAVIAQLPLACVERIHQSEESRHLRDAYLAANIVGPSSINDAHHVALASMAKVERIISWNFKHLVHVEKIRGFNSVNLQWGYPLIDIRAPKEVV